MPLFRCEICQSYEVDIEVPPSLCPNCGTENGHWIQLLDGLDSFTLSAEFSKYIIYKDVSFGRREMQLFFPSINDASGNPLYRYFDRDHPLLQFNKNKEGVFEVFSNFNTKNYFLINDKKITSERVKIRKGDRLSLFSSIQAKKIGDLTIS